MKKCKFCGKSFRLRRPSSPKKFCSISCGNRNRPAPKSAFKKGLVPWNKGKKNWMSKKGKKRMIESKIGKKASAATRKKMSMQRKHNKHPMWKGREASYTAWHQWVVRYRGKAKYHLCLDCGRQAEHWSNVDHKYRRKLSDYDPRCISCHRRYDLEHNHYQLYGRPRI